VSHKLEHGKLAGKHNYPTRRSSRHTTPAAAKLSQGKKAHRNRTSTPNPGMSTWCRTGTVTRQGTKAHKAAPWRLASPKLHTHGQCRTQAPIQPHACEVQESVEAQVVCRAAPCPPPPDE
jgi:hypothetical protein